MTYTTDASLVETNEFVDLLSAFVDVYDNAKGMYQKFIQRMTPSTNQEDSFIRV